MLEYILKQNISNSSEEFFNFTRQGLPLTAFGVSDSYKSYLISGMEDPVLLVTKDMLSAGLYKELIGDFCSKKVVVIPPKDELLMLNKAFSKDSLYERLLGLSELKNADVIITPISAVMQSFSPCLTALNLAVGSETLLSDAVKTLVNLGYKKTENVQGKGSFSVRGDILDVYPINAENPFKIDFFGDEVESVREYEEESRKIIKTHDFISIVQAVEKVFTDSELKELKDKMLLDIRDAKGDKQVNLKVLYDTVNVAIESKDNSLLSSLAPAVSEFYGIENLINPQTHVIFDEPKRSYENAVLCETEFKERSKSLIGAGNAFSFMDSALSEADKIGERFKKFKEVAFQTISSSVAFFNPLKILSPKISSVANYRLDFKEIFSDVSNWLQSGYGIVICTGKLERSERLAFDFSTMGIASEIDGKTLPKNGVLILSEKLLDGFISHENKLVVIGSGNLYSKSTTQKKIAPKRQTFFTAPEVGDYAVHETHGIGRVLGNKKISTTEGTKDYVAVEYQGGDVLYIPVEQLDLLTKYLGAEKHPRLSKIGGKDFERVKNSVKESIKKMSFDLKKLYEERSTLQGFKFGEDKELESLFENAFEFEDTPDQMQANLDIKEDMTSSKVMDRLVCGDVGFGKTEVAFRAVFRAVVNGKQAIMLAPTTILSEQHYKTAVKRFEGFGIRIACLNRFRSPKEQKKILEDLKNGEIDFIIGTHRLLSKDVEFKNPGLLVLDEEQRFGVEHKEKIKLIKNNVDTLTLTATPIPRTLHMSLSGIRSISTINTPPKKRLPVQTYVTEETDVLIKDAISREINRGGQVFLLYNRVESIFSFADKIKSLLPNVKLTVVHGQMEESVLEKNIFDFYEGKSDLLISTTIIENGIDLPKANTLIVIDADKFGLSTLYQLKGRVGRSDRLAYAYFTFKRDKVLTDTAYHRLNAIIEFTEMGSGIKIAMRDLEIRGAGNILGAEQHGHMEKIGYELYSKLLKEELYDEEEQNIDLDIRVNAFIPDGYIESNSARMDAYKEIAEITTLKDADKLKERLVSVYGDMPIEAQNILNISILKMLGKRLKVNEISLTKDEVYMSFKDLSAFSDKGLMDAVAVYKNDVTLSVSIKPKLQFKRVSTDNADMLNVMIEFLYTALS